MNSAIPHEAAVRLGVFATVLVVMALSEALAPRRKRVQGRGWRWSSNLALVAIDTVAVRLLIPTTAVAAAFFARSRGVGLGLHPVLAVIALDFVIYLQHVMFHAVPALWRLHMIHHADRDIDVTTGLRFHPLEILISMGIKLTAIYCLGPAPEAVLAFEVLLNACAMFNHSNVRLPLGLDRVLRLFLVTPDMHRVHHSVHVGETNSNFGFNMPWWDRLFGTYVAQPRDGHEAMTIGLEQFQTEAPARLPWILLVPFHGRGGRYPIGGRE